MPGYLRAQNPAYLPAQNPGCLPAQNPGCLLTQNPGYSPRQKKDGGRAAAVLAMRMSAKAQTRRVSTKFWPDEEVQFNWLVETSRQLKLTGVWRISEVPLISTEVAPVIE